MVEQRILDAFQTMWGAFPEPVLLIQKDRTVLAVNDLARSAGLTAGIKCFSLNPEIGDDEQCQRCNANLALETGKAVCKRETIGDAQMIGYWIPLKEVADAYVHFAIGTAEAMAAAQARAQQTS
jgi:hypothetical protein